jgi:hypothetical protein
LLLHERAAQCCPLLAVLAERFRRESPGYQKAAIMTGGNTKYLAKPGTIKDIPGKALFDKALRVLGHWDTNGP